MTIAIYGQTFQEDARALYQDVFLFMKKNNITLVFESTFLDLLYQNKILKNQYQTFSSYHDFNQTADVLLSFGGDGTILRAVTYVRDKNIPILGINIGRLGFLAKIQKDKVIKYLEQLIHKDFLITKRSLLCLDTFPIVEGINNLPFALNEITISRKNSTSMITVETHLDDEFLTSYWADGLIIATPTGSTGYSLSCGGPILTPEVNSLVITPIAPHNLNARPLVVQDTHTLKLKVSGREDNFLVSLDSRIHTIHKDTQLVISKCSFTIQMIEFGSESFLKTIRTKLLWGEDKRN